MTSPDRPRTGLYLRISQDRRDRAGVERQEPDCRQLADRLGWQVVEVFEDNDISAYEGKHHRPRYEALLDAIRSGRIDAVVCWHSDRLHRDPGEQDTYIKLCKKHGIQNAAVQIGQVDISTPSGEFNIRMLGAMAHYESQHKAERVRAAAKQKAERGEFGGGIRCFGYDKDGMTVRVDEAEEIRRVAAGVLAGQSLRSLVLDLNERSVTTVKGGRWASTNLRSMLLRPRIAGLRVYRGAIIGAAKWPAILPQETWEAVKAVLEDPARRSGGGGRTGRIPTALGTGLYVCGVCEQPAMRRSQSSTRRAAYRCGGHETNGLRHVSRSAEELDAFVEGALLEILGQPGVIAALCEVVDGADDTAITELRSELETIRPRIKKATQMWTDGVMDDEQFADASSQLHARTAEIKSVLAKANRTSPLEILRDVESIERAWDEILTMGQKRAILAEVLTVTVLPAPGGRGVGGTYFEPHAIRLELTDTAGKANCSLTI